MLIYIDGIDGCGKSVLCQHLKEYLPNSIVIPLLNGGPIGTAVRHHYLLNPAPNSNDTFYAMATMVANIETLYDVVLPAIQVGKNVIVDRSLGSYWAYQVMMGKFRNEFALDLFNKVTRAAKFQLVKPDLYIQCEVDIAVANERLSNRETNSIDLLDVHVKEQLIKGYEQFYNIANSVFEWPVERLDCNADLSIVKTKLIKLVDRRRK